MAGKKRATRQVHARTAKTSTVRALAAQVRRLESELKRLRALPAAVRGKSAPTGQRGGRGQTHAMGSKSSKASRARTVAGRATKPKAAPSQTADEVHVRQELQRAARIAKQLGTEERARLVADERNPLFREAMQLGDVLRAAERTKSTARERARMKESAAAHARIGLKDAGRTVVFDVSGRRYKSFSTVPKGRKVYVAHVDRRGVARYLNATDPKTLMKGVRPQIQPQEPRRFDFQRWARLAPREYGEVAGALIGRHLQPVWKGRDITFKTVVEKGDLDASTRKVARVFDEAARSQNGLTQWVADVLIGVAGEKKPVMVTTPVLNTGQFYELDPRGREGPKAKRGGKAMAQRIITYKVRDLVRAELARRGLVSKGSAQRVGRHSWNKGRPRSKWTMDPEGLQPWKGAGRDVVKLSQFQFRLRKIF